MVVTVIILRANICNDYWGRSWYFRDKIVLEILKQKILGVFSCVFTAYESWRQQHVVNLSTKQWSLQGYLIADSAGESLLSSA